MLWKAIYPSFGIALCMAAGHQVWTSVGEYTRRASVASALQQRNQTMRSLGLLRAPRPFQVPGRWQVRTRLAEDAEVEVSGAVSGAYCARKHAPSSNSPPKTEVNPKTRYKYHTEIRTAAVECMPEVCAFASATATYWPMCLCVIEAYA